MADLSNWGQYGALTEKAPYGQHIGLSCKNHPHMRWHTKNIAPIGARNIFYSGTVGPDGKPGQYEPECNCTAADLVVL